MSRGPDIAERVEWTPELVRNLRLLVLEGCSDGQTSRILGLTRGSISSARWRFGLVSPRHAKYAARAVPDDFDQMAPAFSITKCAKHYHSSKRTASKWYELRGITPLATTRIYERKAAATLPAGFTPSYRAPRRSGGNTPQRRFCIPERESTIAASAQLFLQRYGPVIRARTVDHLASNDTWIVHGRRLSEAEMLAIAKRKGWAAAA